MFRIKARKGELNHLRDNYPDLYNRLFELECMPNLIGNKFNTLTKTSIYDIERKFFLEETPTLLDSFMFFVF